MVFVQISESREKSLTAVADSVGSSSIFGMRDSILFARATSIYTLESLLCQPANTMMMQSINIEDLPWSIAQPYQIIIVDSNQLNSIYYQSR